MLIPEQTLQASKNEEDGRLSEPSSEEDRVNLRPLPPVPDQPPFEQERTVGMEDGSIPSYLPEGFFDHPQSQPLQQEQYAGPTQHQNIAQPLGTEQYHQQVFATRHRNDEMEEVRKESDKNSPTETAVSFQIGEQEEPRGGFARYQPEVGQHQPKQFAGPIHPGPQYQWGYNVNMPFGGTGGFYQPPPDRGRTQRTRFNENPSVVVRLIGKEPILAKSEPGPGFQYATGREDGFRPRATNPEWEVTVGTRPVPFDFRSRAQSETVPRYKDQTPAKPRGTSTQPLAQSTPYHTNPTQGLEALYVHPLRKGWPPALVMDILKRRKIDYRTMEAEYRVRQTEAQYYRDRGQRLIEANRNNGPKPVDFEKEGFLF